MNRSAFYRSNHNLVDSFCGVQEFLVPRFAVNAHLN